MNSITKIAEMMTNFVSNQLSDSPSLTEIEQTMQKLLHEVGRQAVEQVVQAQSPTYPDPIITCHCGQQIPYLRQRKASFHTLFGRIEAKRAYYLCSLCRQGTYPLDKTLQLNPNGLSNHLKRLVAMVGVQLPFRTGCTLFEALTLVSVSDQAMGKATQEVGELSMTQEKKQQNQARDDSFLLKRKREARHPVRLYGTLDATKVHIRDDQEHRWRDLKIGAWFQARGCPPTSSDGQWSIQAENIRYFTDICPAKEFGELFWSHGVQQDAQLAHELVILGDGAEWIWNLVDAHFPNAIQILDWFHASEHLMPVAKSIFKGEEEQQQWVRQMKQFLWQGEVEAVISECDALALTFCHDILRTTANYFENHKERMRYDYFRQQGYQIGSGTIESAAKQIGSMRMKVPGAIWNEANARKVAKARASYLSDQWASLPFVT